MSMGHLFRGLGQTQYLGRALRRHEKRSEICSLDSVDCYATELGIPHPTNTNLRVSYIRLPYY